MALETNQNSLEIPLDLIGRIIHWQYEGLAPSQGIVARFNASQDTFSVEYPDRFIDRDFTAEELKSALTDDAQCYKPAQWLSQQRGPGQLEQLEHPRCSRKRKPCSKINSTLVGRLISWKYDDHPVSTGIIKLYDLTSHAYRVEFPDGFCDVFTETEATGALIDDVQIYDVPTWLQAARKRM